MFTKEKNREKSTYVFLIFLRITDNKSNVIIMGDINDSVVSQMTEYECVGKFSLGNINEREGRLIEFCKQFEMIITNIIYTVLKRR